MRQFNEQPTGICKHFLKIQLCQEGNLVQMIRSRACEVRNQNGGFGRHQSSASILVQNECSRGMSHCDQLLALSNIMITLDIHNTPRLTNPRNPLIVFHQTARFFSSMAASRWAGLIS